MKLPKLHLRDLFWLISLVAFGLGWWLDRAKLIDEVHESNERAVQAESQARVWEDRTKRAVTTMNNASRHWKVVWDGDAVFFERNTRSNYDTVSPPLDE